MLEITVLAIGYDENGAIFEVRTLPTYEDEIDQLIHTIGCTFHRRETVKTIEVKLDVACQITASSVEGIGQLKELLTKKFESLKVK
ncbi:MULTISPECIES: hypothetical protein [Vibrio]|uniref:hypothetical protein n=1 Tax=Vibrio TaxID=662 RepID=UPI0003075374|nr:MULTISPECIES: hypothetical protein [Vibrio]OEF38343.1 hypothetical protein OAC_13740 [Vibrio cyclitrophicus 1F273]PMO95502.1 hypothetical protein BCS97_14515 [Vibrio splendidus]PMP21508.1 hypothetical protein BCS89_18830 [Vibrio splendidus]PMP32264.1 hypothetical protein BCS88_15295 [Vibrio splendidus]PMP39199.1 hypothetical protein BCS87_10705 [Vibrio splendidus]